MQTKGRCGIDQKKRRMKTEAWALPWMQPPLRSTAQFKMPYTKVRKRGVTEARRQSGDLGHALDVKRTTPASIGARCTCHAIGGAPPRVRLRLRGFWPAHEAGRKRTPRVQAQSESVPPRTNHTCVGGRSRRSAQALRLRETAVISQPRSRRSLRATLIFKRSRADVLAPLQERAGQAAPHD